MKILIVDDDKFEREGLLFLLNKLYASDAPGTVSQASTQQEQAPENEHAPERFSVQEAKNAFVALELCEAEPFDIIITDIKMPNMDGLKFLKILKEKNYPAVYIIYSGYSDFAYAREAISLDVIDFLVKPAVEEEFYACMHKAIARVQTREQGMQAAAATISGVSAAVSAAAGSQEGRLVGELKAYIAKHYAEDIALEDLAELVQFSQPYLCTLFKKETGQTLIEYLTYYRITQAQELLRQRELRINDIARMVGYKNPSYFNMLFKKQTKMTPREMRKELSIG